MSVVSFEEYRQVAGVGGVDGLVLVRSGAGEVEESSAVTCARSARLADELAALVGELADAVRLQSSALQRVASGSGDSGGEALESACRVAARVEESLRSTVMGSLGGLHVELSELSEQIGAESAAGDPVGLLGWAA